MFPNPKNANIGNGFNLTQSQQSPLMQPMHQQKQSLLQPMNALNASYGSFAHAQVSNNLQMQQLQQSSPQMFPKIQSQMQQLSHMQQPSQASMFGAMNNTQSLQSTTISSAFPTQTGNDLYSSQFSQQQQHVQQGFSSPTNMNHQFQQSNPFQQWQSQNTNSQQNRHFFPASPPTQTIQGSLGSSFGTGLFPFQKQHAQQQEQQQTNEFINNNVQQSFNKSMQNINATNFNQNPFNHSTSTESNVNNTINLKPPTVNNVNSKLENTNVNNINKNNNEMSHENQMHVSSLLQKLDNVNDNNTNNINNEMLLNVNEMEANASPAKQRLQYDKLPEMLQQSKYPWILPPLIKTDLKECERTEQKVHNSIDKSFQTYDNYKARFVKRTDAAASTLTVLAAKEKASKLEKILFASENLDSVKRINTRLILGQAIDSTDDIKTEVEKNDSNISKNKLTDSLRLIRFAELIDSSNEIPKLKRIPLQEENLRPYIPFYTDHIRWKTFSMPPLVSHVCQQKTCILV